MSVVNRTAVLALAAHAAESSLTENVRMCVAIHMHAVVCVDSFEVRVLCMS